MACDGCGHEIIVGFGHGPVSESHRDEFETWKAFITHTVNDC